MRKIMITGGTGFVGQHMKKTEYPGFDCFYLSERDYRGQLRMDWDYIIHLANIAPTRVLAIAKDCDARVLCCSSGIVYHPENDNEYRRNKMVWEAECLASGVDVVIARLFTFYGKGLDDNKAVVQFEKAAKANKPIKIWGDGNTIRSYMHGDEMGRWMWAILFHGEHGEVYDVGSDEPITILDLAMRVRARNLSLSEIVVEGFREPMPYYMPENTAKTRALLTNVVN